MTLAEVMSFTGRSRYAIYNDIKHGLFVAPVRVGKASRWRESHLVAWMETLQSGVDTLATARATQARKKRRAQQLAKVPLR